MTHKTRFSRSRPNILWFSFEDTMPAYGCYGDPVARTPNLDRLAAKGSLFTNAFSTAGVCAPARSAIITGMYPTSMGTHHMRTAHTSEYTPELPTPYSAVPPHYVRCFSEYLRAAGYYCTNNVKTDYQFEPPITAWDELSRDAHWRNRPDPEQPFFSVFNPTRTHESGMWERHKKAAPPEGPDLTFDPADVIVPPLFPDTSRVRESLARMYTNIERSDAELGERLAELEEDGLADNTIVFHWSDHGPLPRGKRWTYDAGIHVPLIVRVPGQEHTRTDRLVSTIDLGPTVLSLCGLQIPVHMQGTPFLGDAAKDERDYVYATRDRYDTAYDMVRAVRDTRFKYIRNYHPEAPYLLWVPYRDRHPIMQEMRRCFLEGSLNEAQEQFFAESRPVEELYDTVSDPNELHNLADRDEHAHDLARLRAALDTWRSQVGDMGEVDESVMVRTWYPNGERPTTAAPIAMVLEPTGEVSDPVAAGAAMRVTVPGRIQLHSATQGASIAYRLEPVGGGGTGGGTEPRQEAETGNRAADRGGDRDGGSGGSVAAERWELYTGPVAPRSGRWLLRAKAVRIGYAVSEERSLSVDVE